MPLPKWELRNGGPAACTACGSVNSVRLFPAALALSAAPETVPAVAGEAECFDHPGKRAAAACRVCGRFVCQLCAVEMGTEIWCPSCVANPAASARGGGDSTTSRMLYDTWALFVPFGLLAIWPFTILSGPAVAALAIMKWKAPLSLVRRTRWRFALGLVIGLAHGGLWIWFFVYLAAKVKSGA
jgi:hypothetical protein